MSWSITYLVPAAEINDEQQQVSSGHWFRGGLDGYKWIPCGNLHKSAVSKDGHGSMWHQILLAYLRPGIIKISGCQAGMVTVSC